MGEQLRAEGEATWGRDSALNTVGTRTCRNEQEQAETLLIGKGKRFETLARLVRKERDLPRGGPNRLGVQTDDPRCRKKS